MLVVRASIRPKFDSSRDPRRLFGQPLGGHKAGRPRETIAIIEGLRGIEILKADALTANIYAEIRFELEKHGNLIPQNDIWIAAATLQADVPLVTRDQHFRRIPRLKVLEY